MLRQIERMQYIDQLIRLKSTGCPEDFAEKLGVSRRQLFNIIEELKILGAPIYYNKEYKSYCYEYQVRLLFDFIEN
jgi:predicted DNA-binding transcriptional regulator YafY